MQQASEVLEEMEIVPPEEPTAVELRRPAAPMTIEEIAALKGGAQEVIEARIGVLVTLRKAALKVTHPEDWLLFQDKEGRVVGYLQDAGCDRVRDLYGIEIFDVGDPEKIEGENTGEFFFTIIGSGRCKLTNQTVEKVIGGRGSNEDFVKDKTGMQKQLDVMKAARANLDGNLTRELAGLKSVPQAELVSAWEGTHKKIENCRHGRGFGSQAERQGALEHVEAPECPDHKKKMNFVKGGIARGSGKAYPAFWSCPDRSCKKHNIADSKWREELASRSKTEEAAPEVEDLKTKQNLIDALDKIQQDPIADQLIFEHGKTLKVFIGEMNLHKIKKAELEEVVLRSKEALAKHKKENPPAEGEGVTSKDIKF